MESQTLHFYQKIDYPAGREEIIEKRVKKLKSIGIELEKYISKGVKSTVFKGILKPPEPFKKPIDVAVKFTRSDVQKKDFLIKEGKILELLDGKEIAPKTFYYDSEVLVMEYIDGEAFSIEKFLHRKNLKEIIVKIIEKCFDLDEEGIEHSELKGTKHIIITPENSVRIIDFESAKLKENPRNLLQFIGFHLLSKPEILKSLNISQEDLEEGIETYKKNPVNGLNFIKSTILKQF